MQKKTKTNFIEKIFYSNRSLLIFSLIVSIAIWAGVKMNYSEDSTRVISDLQISTESMQSAETDYTAFYAGELPKVDIEIKGKMYDINQYNLSKDDIVVEAKSDFVYESGYRMLTITAKIDSSVAGDIQIASINPSRIMVYYDRPSTVKFNVLAKINISNDKLVEGDYSVGSLVPSLSTVEVTGPSHIVEQIENVYFNAELDEANLPLKETVEVPANVSYGLAREQESQFLTSALQSDEATLPAVTIPIYINETVKSTVKFINQPEIYIENPPKFTITPSEVEISYNPTEGEFDEFNVGSIDFKQLQNKVNKIEFEIDKTTIGANIIDHELEKFTVTVDLSSLSKRLIDEVPKKAVLINQNTNYNYTINFDENSLNQVVIIGPKASLDKTTMDDLQIEIDVSSVDLNRRMYQNVVVSNISISNEAIKDCWIVGEYTAQIQASLKATS